MNKDTFLRLVPSVREDSKPHNNDYIYTTRLPLDNYDFDYSHPIVEYMKACGCVIKRTNWNAFGGFYIYYLKPTRYISPEEFIDNYKGGKHYDSLTSATINFFFVSSVVVIILFVFMWVSM